MNLVHMRKNNTLQQLRRKSQVSEVFSLWSIKSVELEAKDNNGWTPLCKEEEHGGDEAAAKEATMKLQ